MKIKIWLPVNETFTYYPSKFRIDEPDYSDKSNWVETYITQEYLHELKQQSKIDNSKLILG